MPQQWGSNMAQICTLSDIFQSAWGITEPRRSEIEGGGYGCFEKILNEEIQKAFFDADGVAALMGVRQSTARRWLKDGDARCIIHENKHLYYKQDVMVIVEKRKAKKVKAA